MRSTHQINTVRWLFPALLIIGTACGVSELEDGSFNGGFNDASVDLDVPNTLNASPEDISITPDASPGDISIIPDASIGDADSTPGGDTPPINANPFTQPNVRLVGRVDLQDTEEPQPRFAWSGTGFVAAFRGTTATITLNHDGDGNEFTVIVDDQIQPKVVAESGTHQYVLVDNLEPGEHVLEFYRQTEYLFDDTEIIELDIGSNNEGLTPPAVERRIEFIGDSITTGFGSENADDPNCTLLPQFQDHYATYGAIASQRVNAENITIAYSGRAIIDYEVHNEGQRVFSILNEYFQTTTQPTPEWDFSIIPDVVVINLGTNDYNDGFIPIQTDVIDGYIFLLETIRSNYPDAFILATISPMLGGQSLQLATSAMTTAVETVQQSGDNRLDVFIMADEIPFVQREYACFGHPTPAMHQIMADTLVPRLETIFTFLGR